MQPVIIIHDNIGQVREDFFSQFPGGFERDEFILRALDDDGRDGDWRRQGFW